MSIHWSECDDNNVRNGRACSRWVGKRHDGKHFFVHYVRTMGFICRATSGKVLGTGQTLALAKSMAEE